MALCENCGNDYDKTFKIIMGQKEHIFDSFECAINSMAPQCAHCKTKIVGHGVDARGQVFCCEHCSRAERRND
jgi:hypothetical protein